MPVSGLTAEVYKWVDENGDVHYGDHLPLGGRAEKIEIKKELPQDPGYKERMEWQSRLLEIYDEEHREKISIRARLEEEEKNRQANCARAQQELEKIKNAGYLYEDTDDPANPRILDKEERIEATAKAESRMRKWCKK